MGLILLLIANLAPQGITALIKLVLLKSIHALPASTALRELAQLTKNVQSGITVHMVQTCLFHANQANFVAKKPSLRLKDCAKKAISADSKHMLSTQVIPTVLYAITIILVLKEIALEVLLHLLKMDVLRETSVLKDQKLQLPVLLVPTLMSFY